MSTDTVLEVVRSFCEEQGLPVPSALVGATDAHTRQLRRMLQTAVTELLEYPWQQQRVTLTWTSAAGADQGALVTILPGYNGMVKNSLWNKTRDLPILGPLTEAQWAALQVFPGEGPEDQYIIQGDHLYVSPALNGTDELTVVYNTTYGYLSNAGVPQDSLLADNQTVIFPDVVIGKALEVKWKAAKGEAYADDSLALMNFVSKNLVRDTAPTLRLDGAVTGRRPGIVIPAGDWPNA